MDIRLKQLSYSSRLTLHSCPRKYQLYKLQAQSEEINSGSESVTFSFGHAVGAGIQAMMSGASLQQAIWSLFLAWEADILADNPKQNKSIWLSIVAIQKFAAIRAAGFLKDWEVVQYEGRPAVELSFIVTLPDGFTYKGFVDVVLVNKITGEVMVLEIKTTSSNDLTVSTYKNSAQAIGYSVVLDVLFPELSSYTVLYLVYKSKSLEYEQLPFKKSYLQRALWIKELLLDVEKIKLYETEQIYPMHGESCNDFYRDCEYLNLCTLSTERLASQLTPELEQQIQEDINNKFQIKLSILDLINAQLSKEKL